MDNLELKYQITALIDGEISSQAEADAIRRQIELDPELKREYEILLFTKSLVKSKCKFHPTPEKLKARIIKQIKPAETKPIVPFSFLQNIFSRPAYAITAAAAVILLALVLLLSRSSDIDPVELASEQQGENNMLVQAANNFNSIIAGKLAPQIITDDANNVKDFFVKSGVEYSTCVPAIKDWRILGAVVSQEDNEKFAHHVYTNEQGKLIYLYQVYESCLSKGEKLHLSKKLIEYLDQGNCFFSSKDNNTILLKKIEGNICAIVSNTSQTELENLFCSL